jgi:hypothetical protein
MTRTVASSLAIAIVLALASGAWAAEMPAIRTSETNVVPECATPGRLTAYLKSRNENLDPRFEKIAVEYMRHGEQLGLRWDYTFFQMLLETGHLSFRGDRGRRGDVKPTQNNFAGLGATGKGAPGESFPDVSTGVLAHLQHVLVYAGETVENPVAERTRKVQEWGILKSMQKRAKGSVTFAHLATKWAPGADYVAGIEALAGRFREGFCNIADPHPEWIAEARGEKPAPTSVAAASAPPTERVSSVDLAKRAIAEGKAENDDRRKGLGAGGLAVVGKPNSGAATPSYSILNAPQPEAQVESEPAQPDAAARTKTAKVPARPDKPQPFATASAAGSLLQRPLAKPAPEAKTAPEANPAPVAGAKCRVWTASYGGQKALIIRASTDKGTDLTVLDVNEGAERREAEAYIAAYAKGGAIEAEFTSQTQALEKAFELCPEN